MNPVCKVCSLPMKEHAGRTVSCPGDYSCSTCGETLDSMGMPLDFADDKKSACSKCGGPMKEVRMTPESITVATVVEASDREPADWEGQCFGFASVAARLLGGPPRAQPVYGHWIGPVSPDGFWRKHVGSPFIQHGWVLLADGRVLDPTRWSFEAVDPYIYLGPPDHYDEGGNALRRALLRPAPKKRPATGARKGDWDSNASELRTLRVTGLAAQHVAMLIGLDEVTEIRSDAVVLTLEQVFWLANAPLEMLGEHSYTIYFAISRAGVLGAIPIDNRRRVEREAGVGLDPREK